MENSKPQLPAAEEKSVLTTPENQLEKSGRTAAKQPQPPQNGDADRADFESLIQGRFKEAFAERVQKISDGRFKEMKQLQQQNEQLQQQLKGEPAKPKAEAPKSQGTAAAAPAKPGGELADLLIQNGVAPQVAAAAAYLEQIMQDSAQNCAVPKPAAQPAPRAERPTENGLHATVGVAAKPSVSGLSPAQRRALSQKALMGEKIGF